MSNAAPLFTVDAEALVALKAALVDLHMAVHAVPLIPSNSAQAHALLEARRLTLAALSHSAALWPVAVPIDQRGPLARQYLSAAASGGTCEASG